jgi:tetratricopeptide (TPR) repeat protein
VGFSVLRLGVAAFLMLAGLVLVSRALADNFETCAKASGDKAIAACTRAISSGRFHGHNLAVVYYNRGNTYQANGDNDRAIADFTEAIRLDPKYVRAYNNRGNAYHDKGDNDRAIADYTEAIRLDPKYTFAYNGRGNAYQAKGDNDRAIADFTEAIRLDPKYVFAYSNRCWARALAGRDLAQALDDCNKALRLRPGDSDTLNSRGLVQLKLMAFDLSVADYSAAIAQNPKDASSLYGRGIAKLKSGDSTGGDADIAAAKAIKPDIADVYAGYGVK